MGKGGVIRRQWSVVGLAVRLMTEPLMTPEDRYCCAFFYETFLGLCKTPHLSRYHCDDR